MALRALKQGTINVYPGDEEKRLEEDSSYPAASVTCRIPSDEEWAEIEDTSLQAVMGNIRMQRSRAAVKAIRKLMTGWENILDENGKAIPFNKESPGENVSRLDSNFRWKIYREIEKTQVVTAEDFTPSASPVA